MSDIEERLARLEDQFAICQVVSTYGYALDAQNAEVVGNLYAEDASFIIGDIARFEGREAIGNLTNHPMHLELVRHGVAHMSTMPHIAIDGDRAVATCHGMVAQHGDQGFFIGRLSASRIELKKSAEGRWEIVQRANYLLNGDPAAQAITRRAFE